MDIIGMDQNGNFDDDISLPLNSYTKGVYGEPAVLPRVGNQYQVEIPPLISESEYRSYTRDPFQDENKGGPRDFVMGLPISIVWANQEVKPIIDGKIKFLCDLEHASSRPYEPNVESSDTGSRIVIMETVEMEEKTDEINGFLAPGSCGDSWSGIEKASFLLGLYIFRKNFVQVKKFVETKTMGEILLAYHTKFYQTAEYRKWSDCRKVKTRNCALGRRLFTGWRQHELLFRLVRGISEELRNALMQVSKNFSDGKISLEEYTFSLKNMVGIKDLVNAVGIGGGEKDLTAERRHHCYLQSRTRSRCTNVMAFTVVDTSLSNGKTYELRDLRDLPVEVSRISISQSADDTPDELTDESDCPCTMPVEEDNENDRRLIWARSENGTSVKRKDLETGTSSDHGIGSRNAKSGNDNIAPDGKRCRRLTACSEEGTSQDVVNLTCQSSDSPEISENIRASSIENFEERAQDNEPNVRPLFDLNLPAEPLDLDCNDIAPEEAEPKPHNAPDEPQNAPNVLPLFDLNLRAEPLDLDCNDIAPEEAEPKPQNAPDEPMAGAEQLNLNSRRQSSRNRPPTARALQAIAHGFLFVSRRRGSGESSRSRSRSSQEEGRGSGLGTSDVADGTNSNISGNGEI